MRCSLCSQMGYLSWNFVPRRVATKGLESLRKLDKVMELFVCEISNTSSEGDLDIINLL